MNLTDEQKQKVTQWINEGQQLSDVQKNLDTEFGLKLTYMEVRFLIDDLGLNLQDSEPAKTQPEEVDLSQVGKQGGSEREGTRAAGGVSVSLHEVTRPDAVVSGRVTFSDGVSAEWYVDQLGRLGLMPEREGYQPSEKDLQAFQSQLQREISRLGM